jgi:hypothetical protein
VRARQLDSGGLGTLELRLPTVNALVAEVADPGNGLEDAVLAGDLVESPGAIGAAIDLPGRVKAAID